MTTPINIINKPKSNAPICVIGDPSATIAEMNISSASAKILKSKIADWQKYNTINHDGQLLLSIPKYKGKSDRTEHFRQIGAAIWSDLKSFNQNALQILSGDTADVMALAEGLISKDYRFEKYKKSPDTFEIKSLSILKGLVKSKDLAVLKAKIEGTFFARDLVNEPANVLTATELAKRIKEAGNQVGYDVEVLSKTKIKALKMGGLLSVNQGSVIDPTFSIITYKPENAKNKRPVVLVGKGIVYDTGGLSLKPTANSMDIMKCDMGGAAAVAGAIHAAALAELSIYVVGLIPATDNQPAPDAYQPGDVITMYDGTQVEVMNTDAEGRLVMADALAYAKQLKPELAIDLATLTGSSMRAVGSYAGCAMGTAGDKMLGKLKTAGMESWERVVEFPLWDDYATDLKSDIADMRNLGPTPFADVIIAGKFLEHFTDYPWIHIDIAGPAFLPSAKGYLPKGGTGFGVNLLFHFLNSYSA